MHKFPDEERICKASVSCKLIFFLLHFLLLTKMLQRKVNLEIKWGLGALIAMQNLKNVQFCPSIVNTVLIIILDRAGTSADCFEGICL